MDYNIPQIFNNNFTITQFFGQNLADYSKFGMKGHNGVDFVPTNDQNWDIHSVSGGVVIEIGSDQLGFGNFIKIKCDNQIWLYAHLSKVEVVRNQIIQKSQIIGQKIGVMGNTGNSTGAHLHLGLKIVDNLGNVLDNQNGYFGAIDPLPYLIIPTPPTLPTPPAPPKPPRTSIPTVPMPKIILPTDQTWQKLEKVAGPEHTKYIRDLINSPEVDKNLMVNDYADRIAERIADKKEFDEKIAEIHGQAIGQSVQVEQLQQELAKKPTFSDQNFKDEPKFEQSPVINQEPSENEQKEKFDFNKFWVGMSKNATIQSILGVIITSGISWMTTKIPELQPIQSEITLALLGCIGAGAVGQNASNILKSNLKNH